MTDFFYRHLANASQQKKVLPGQGISLKFDLALAHDGSGPQILNIINGNERTLPNTGRIGAKEAKIYLASPLTVALSAVNGRITEPR